MIVLACNSDERILATFETMRQLRPHLNDKASYLALIKQMQHEERFNPGLTQQPPLSAAR